MDLTVLNRNFERIGVIDDFTSLIWHPKFYTAGVFKINLPMTDNNLALVQEKNIIHKPGSDEAGIVDNYYYSSDEEGRETIEASGYFLTGLLGRRIVPKLTTFYASYRDAMRSLVDQNAITTDAKRVIPHLKLADVEADTAEKKRLQVTGKNLLSYLGKLSQVAEIGFKCRYMRTHMEFYTYTGQDRSRRQSINPRVIFAHEYDNLGGTEYTYNEIDTITAAYVGGEGEGAARTIIEVDSGATGLDRYEVFVDSGATREEGMTDAEYLRILNQEGLEVITPAAENFAGSMVNSRTTIYKQDFDLGDVVTVFNKRWNKELSVRITEVEEVNDTSGERIVVYFGSTERTIADILNE